MFTCAKLETLTATLMKTRVFWDVTPYKNVELLDPENVSSAVLRNVGNYLPIDTVISQKTCGLRF